MRLLLASRPLSSLRLELPFRIALHRALPTPPLQCLDDHNAVLGAPDGDDTSVPKQPITESQPNNQSVRETLLILLVRQRVIVSFISISY